MNARRLPPDGSAAIPDAALGWLGGPGRGLYDPRVRARRLRRRPRRRPRGPPEPRHRGAGPHRPRAPRPPGRLGGRGGHRRRRGHPDPGARTASCRRGRRRRLRPARGRAATPSGSPSCPTTPTTPPRPAPVVEGSPTRRAWRVLGWREVPVDDSTLGGDGPRGRSPAIDAGLRGPAPARGRPVASRRSPSTGWPSCCASGPSTPSTDVYFPSLSARTIVYKGMLTVAPARPVLPRPVRRAARVRAWPWCTRASPPTPSRAGRWPTPTATSPTTARSTPWPGNRNWMRAREALLAHRPASPATCRGSSRSARPGPATRPPSTRCSSCSHLGGRRCPTPS